MAKEGQRDMSTTTTVKQKSVNTYSIHPTQLCELIQQYLTALNELEFRENDFHYGYLLADNRNSQPRHANQLALGYKRFTLYHLASLGSSTQPRRRVGWLHCCAQ